MSIQLIVFPQNDFGIVNPIGGNNTQVVATPTIFTSVTAATSVALGSVANIPQAAINAIQPSIIPNTWSYGYATGGGAGGGFVNFIPMFPNSALLQNLGNLVVNGVYDLEISWISSAGSTVIVSIYNGTVLTSQTSLISSTVVVATQFTAPSVNDTTIVISYNAQLGGEVIHSVYASLAAFQPSGAVQVLEDGQVLCDLYEDEDIPLSLSVDDFKNVAEKVQSYSKAFNLPATKRNNQIFDNIFEITRSNDGVIFNPYKKTKCVLKQDGFILFEGYLRMLDVTDKEGETSYNVNLYSEVVALADVLGDRAFRDLDFTELEHEYNKTQIKYSWNDSGTGITYTNPSTSGFRNAFSTVKYPFVDWNKQWYLGSSGNPVLTSLETAFRPFINIKYLIDRIFNQTDFPFTYESEFFDTDDFKKLYMDFNWGVDNAPVVFNSTAEFGIETDIPLTSSFATINPTPITSVPSSFGFSSGVFTAQEDNQSYNLYMILPFIVGSSGVTSAVEAKVTVNGNPVNSWSSTLGNVNYEWYGINQTYILQAGDTLEIQAKDPDNQTAVVSNEYWNFLPNIVMTTSAFSTTDDTLLGTLRGELGQWDFLKGLLTMFNLVTLVDEDNPDNIIIEPYSDVFIPTATAGNTLANRGIQHDWTDKIDVSEMKLTPLTDLNRKTIFKFVEDDDDYPFNYYKNQVGGHLYGSKKFNAGNEFNILFGEDEIVAEPFAATIVKPLMSQFHDFVTPAIYAYGDDGVWEGFENSPRIMYNNGIKDTGASYFIPAQNGVVGSAAETDFLQFSHLSDVPTIPSTPTVAGSLDFHFGECQLMPSVGLPVLNNLFNLYWLPYYLELYNPNTRIMTIKVNLSPSDINTFKFNDTVYLKNRVFRVNKIDYKPNDLATVEFILTP